MKTYVSEQSEHKVSNNHRLIQNPLITVRGLNKTFNKQVLFNINFDIYEGNSMVVIGGSGCGKSVLLKTLAGFFQPDSNASIQIDGQDVSYKHIKNRTNFTNIFGMLFQGDAIFDSLPIWKNICFAELNEISDEEALQKALVLLEKVDLAPNVAYLYPNEISGGMRKRVAFARAISQKPKLLFLDEPTSGLDPITASKISNIIGNLSRGINATTVTITHDMHCLRRIASHVIMLRDGKIEWSGTHNEFYDSGNAYVQEFINSAS